METREDWVRDEEVIKCYSCFVEFGFFTRRHHCRGCGNVFCSRCTTRKLILPSFSPKPLRVCERCWRQAEKKLQNLGYSHLSQSEETETPPPLSFPQSDVSEAHTHGIQTSTQEKQGTLELQPFQAESLTDRVVTQTPTAAELRCLDKDLITAMKERGYGEDTILEFYKVLSFKGLSTEDISIVFKTFIVNNNSAVSMQQKVELLQKELKSHLTQKEQFQNTIQDLERAIREKENQVRILTGGFDFDTYQRVHSKKKVEANNNECIVCMENEPSFKTSCGCQKICALCYYQLPSKICPSCLQSIK